VTDDLPLFAAHIRPPPRSPGPLAELAFRVGGQAKALPWGPEREQQFQAAMTSAPYADWSRQFQARYGQRPDLDDPDYNYRLAYALGVQPQAYAHDPGLMHWSSAAPVPPYAQPAELKSAGHDTKWMERFMTLYGVDPHEAGPDAVADALRRGIIPLRRP
jgi:hypothetical protein